MTPLRPLLWPTVVTVPGVALLAGLGTWQVERLEWKTALIAERESRLARPVAVLRHAPERTDDLDFRRVAVRGEYLHDREFRLLSRTSKGRAGVHVVTPLLLRPPLPEARVVLINRGWAPNDLADPERRRAGQVEGLVDVVGIARAGSGRRGRFAPENDPAAGVWHRVDVERMADFLGSAVAPFVVEADAAPNPGGYPIGGQTRIRLRNDHLGYAITWYALAAALTIVYLTFAARVLRRRARGGR